MKVNLLIVATEKYIQFLPALVASVREHFLTDHDVCIKIFTNRIVDANIAVGHDKIKFFEVEHKPWPYTTLYRYHFFQKYMTQIFNADYYYYIDADTLIKAKITDADIFGDRVGTQHCGYVNARGTYEERKMSTSYIKPMEGKIYFGGGFWGFSHKEFWHFINKACWMINEDHNNGLIPIWHDESVLNHYFVHNSPDKVLTPSFHYPESRTEHYKAKWPEDYECKILLLDKNHKEIRE